MFNQGAHTDITHDIIGAAYEVYKVLGPGLLESLYELALEYELKTRGHEVKTQVRVPFLYKGVCLNNDLRLDMIVDDSVIIELKSVEEINKLHYMQLRTYLNLTNKKVGLLINFNTDNMRQGIRRIDRLDKD